MFRKPLFVTEDTLTKYLKLQKPCVINSIQRTNHDEISSMYLMQSGVIDDSDNTDDLIIPPLNTDIRMVNVLPEYKSKNHFSVNPHINMDNFSWHKIEDSDSKLIRRKKLLMHPVQNQHMCGSCWAMSLAACISDCFVVSGAVDWMPRIAPTFIMMTIPKTMGNGQCQGGNPAATTLALESLKIADTSCIDYSWCSNDKKVCTSSSAANHFKGTLGGRLNENIPIPESACYFDGDRYLYQIDPGSEALFITDNMSADNFRQVVKKHIIEYGPPLAGYVVLNNFISGKFTDPSLNQGIYFDRADYSKSPLVFSDSNADMSQLSGLHAVSVVGYGVAKNVNYDNGKYADVCYWIAKNSWGSAWGHTGGFFKIAMYPWNKLAQFGKQINVHGSNVGGMILIRCTKPPTIGKLPSIHDSYLKKIVRSMNDDYYKSLPQTISKITHTTYDTKVSTYIIIGIVIIVIILLMILKHRQVL